MDKILFIGLPYHNYISAISNEMESLGYEVHFYPVELRNTWHKILRILAPAAYQKILSAFHSRIVEKEKNNKYCYVVFLQVHTFSMSNFLRLKQEHPESKFVFYSWDALSPKIDYKPYLSYFDSAYTFDPNDAIDNTINYLPLFCSKPFQNLKPLGPKYDVYMVGNLVNIDRYEAISAFEKYCRQNGIVFRKWLKCSPVVAANLISKGYVLHGLKLHSIPQKQFIMLLQNSTAVFDFANHKQVGYTMRFIENMCAGKKIITNNKRAFSEPFYSPDRFLVFNDLIFDGVKDFLNMPMINTDEHFERFYIQTFVNTLLS